MSKHNRRKRSSSPLGEAGVGLFFSEVLPFIENLEKDDHLLLVLPGIPERGTATHPESPEEHRAPESPALTQGIVIGSDLALEINADYVQRMAEYTRQCGSLESYFDFRARNPKWAAKHNPDQMLLNICRAARYVIAYRYGLSPASPNGEELHSSELPNLDAMPLFITMMGSSDEVGLSPSGERGESLPQSIGYELNGEITLEEYKEKKSEEVSPVES